MIRRAIAATLTATALISAPIALASAQSYPARPALGAPKPFAVPASETYRLPNGMQVTLIPYGQVPKAVVSLRIYAGGLNAGERTGLTAMTTNLLSEGAAGRTGAQIAEAAAAMGGNLGVGGDLHETSRNSPTTPSASSPMWHVAPISQRRNWSGSVPACSATSPWLAPSPAQRRRPRLPRPIMAPPTRTGASTRQRPR
jgi:hypothetical protein